MSEKEKSNKEEEITLRIWSAIIEDGRAMRAYTKQDNVYMSHLNNQPKIRSLLENGSVLEVGPGTGKYATMLIEKFNVRKYTVLDLKENIEDSLINLFNQKKIRESRGKPETEIEGIYAENYSSLFGQEFDVLIANNVFTETPKKYRENLLNNVMINCKSSMIHDQIEENDAIGLEPMGSFYKELYSKVYNKVIFEPTGYSNCYCLIGYNDVKEGQI